MRGSRLFSLFLCALLLSCGRTGRREGGAQGGVEPVPPPPPAAAAVEGALQVIEPAADPSDAGALRPWALLRLFYAMESGGGQFVVAPKTADAAEFVSALQAAGFRLADSAENPQACLSSYCLIEAPELRERWKKLRPKLRSAAPSDAGDELWRDFREFLQAAGRSMRMLTEQSGAVSLIDNNYVRHTKQIEVNREQWALGAYELPAVWQSHGRGRPEVVVAVVDTGVRLNHPNLSANLLAQDGYDFVSDPQNAGDGDGRDANPDAPPDPQELTAFHGTHVAGIVAAVRTAASPIDGVAGGVKILPVRALGFRGGTDYDVAQAILYAAGLENISGKKPRQPANILNLSLGGAGESIVLKDAVRKASRKGVIVVAAAGNEETDQPSYPAAYPEAIGVGALGPGFRYAPYSNYGINAKLFAPGGGEPKDDDQDGDGVKDGILSTSVKGATDRPSFSVLSGTSMASPFVAGVAGLILSVRPELSPGEVSEILLGAGKGLSIDAVCPGTRCGRGRVNVPGALAAAGAAEPKKRVIEMAETSKRLTGAAPSGAVALRIVEGEAPRIIDTIFSPASASGWLTVETETAAGELRVNLSARPGPARQAWLTLLTNASAVRRGAEEWKNGVVEIAVSYLPSPGSGGPESLSVVLMAADGSRKIEARTTASRRAGYRFRLEAPRAASYFVYAGTDSVRPGILCKRDDFCGAYGSIESPTAVHVEAGKTVSGIDFSVTRVPSSEHEIGLGSAGGG